MARKEFSLSEFIFKNYKKVCASLGLILISLLVLLAMPNEAKAAPIFVKVTGDKLTLNGQPIIFKGSNFYPHEGPWQYFWTQWDGQAVYKDLARAAELGNNCVRILVPYGGTFGWVNDNSGEIPPEYLDQLRQMVQIAGSLNQRVILTLFDFYGTYPSAGSKEEFSNLTYLRTIVNAFRDDDRVMAWDLHNEPDNYNQWKEKNDPEAALNWLTRIGAAIRTLDPNHLITVGPGRFESFFQSDSAGNTLAKISDFISIHSYNARDLNNIISKVREVGGKPIFMEEVGWPSGPIFNTEFTEAAQLENYKLIAEAAKNQNVSGLMEWMLWDMLPYGIFNYETFQNYFGLIRRNGTLKPAAAIWRDNYQATNLPGPSVSSNLAFTKQPEDSTPRPRYFPETDHYVATPLKEFWRRAGGWEVFGFPLTDAFSSEDGKTVIQYFEKGRFEFHPERLQSPDYKKYSNIYKYLYLIDRGFLGTELSSGRNFPPGQRLPDDPNYRWFEDTKHGLAEPFYSYWQNHMGADLFGSPISEPFEETNPEDGGTRLVQYFGRVRLEFHPEFIGTSYAVTVGNLGTEMARAKDWLNEATPGYRPTANVQNSILNNNTVEAGSPAFTQTWERTDKPIADGKVSRTWLWGEKPFQTLKEPYSQAEGGQRQVQYYDKSRMEITNPNGDASSKWYVTNGLLVKEMISGQLQLGDNQYQSLAPANVPLAGDPAEVNPNAPTYASLNSHLAPEADRSNQAVNALLNKDGSLSSPTAPPSSNFSLKLVHFEAAYGHNIADVFWNFMTNTRGLLYQNGKYTEGDVVDWTFSIGLPIAEPYWTRSKVGSVEKEVLVQAFERRVLTYTPSNNAGFQVEMGNVGQHYYQWRYGSNSPAPAQVGDASALNGLGGLVWRRIVKPQTGSYSSLYFAPNPAQATNAGNLAASATLPTAPIPGSSLAYTAPNQAGQFTIRLNDFKGNDRAVTFGMAPALSPDNTRLAYSKFILPWKLELNLLDLNTGQNQKIQTQAGLSSVFSPDSKTLAFISYVNSQASIALRGPGGDIKLLKSYDASAFAVAGLNWSPDNRFIAYSLFSLGGREGGIVVNSSEVHIVDAATGVDIKVADNAARPIFAPDGKNLAFLGWGKDGLFVADWGNGGAAGARLIGQAQGCRDECANTGTPAFSPDNQWLAATAPNGGLAAFRLSNGTTVQLTAPSNAYDRDPVWR